MFQRITFFSRHRHGVVNLNCRKGRIHLIIDKNEVGHTSYSFIGFQSLFQRLTLIFSWKLLCKIHYQFPFVFLQYEVITKIQGERDVFPYNDFPSDTLRRSQGTLRRPPNYDPRAEVPTEWGDRRSVRVSVASLKDLKARGAARLSRHSQVLDGESTEMLLMDMEEQPQEQGGNKQKEETEAVENTNPWSMRRWQK